MDRKMICYNCFQERETQEGPCPYCGFDLAENEKNFPVALRAGTVLNGRYIIGRVLGQGGFGITYLALDTQLNAKVAIKEFMPGEIATRVGGTTVSVLAENRSEEFTYGAERFQEEARTLAKFIGNPNIAGVSSYFDENDTSYFVMDYIEGISFKTYIANHGGKISVEETLNVMIPVLRALTAVHAEGFIHRDVTPDNIYITKDGMVKLLDFGSARYSIGDKSKSLGVILKVGYAPKEQYIHRSRQGPFTDVYSCAACFYAAITGFLPPESLERLDEDTLVPISQCGIEIPEYLDRAILKGLAVQPEDRFQSAAEFLGAIESQQVVEVPASGGVAPTPAPEKKKVKPALIAGLAAAVVVVLGIGIFLGRQGNAPTANPQNSSIESPISDEGSGERDNLPPLKEAEVPSITIQGVEYNTDLRELDLSDAYLTNVDIEPLCYMINLVDLTLPAQSEITDISPIAGLTELRVLKIQNTDGARLYLDDLSPLAGLVNLEQLRIDTHGIPNFDWAENMTNLQSLVCYGNDAVYTTLDPLKNLTKLERLRLPNTSDNVGACDIQGLTGLTSLTDLEVNCTVQDFSPLQNLTKLQRLMIYKGYSIEGSTSLEGLKSLTNLRELTINLWDDEALSVDLSPLTGLTKLQYLDLEIQSNGSGPAATNLSALGNLTDLRNLVLHIDNITDLSPLRNLKKLQTLEVSTGNQETITDWSPVDHVPNVTKG